jgi:DNA end-binding protein Ku
MPRAYWKGFLLLSLVTCPIELFPASSQADKTHFHQINKKTGNRLRQQMSTRTLAASSIATTRGADN